MRVNERRRMAREGRIHRGGELGKWEGVWELFHRVWGHCTMSPEYDKQVWKDLQAKLLNIQEEQDARKRVRRRNDR
jgi:hypothetical protein